MIELALAYVAWPVPARYRSVEPAVWAEHGAKDYPEEWEVAKNWLSRFRRYLVTSPNDSMKGCGLTLVGEPGTGKTMLASSFLNYLHLKGFSTAFARHSDFYRLSTLHYRQDEDVDMLHLLERAACVVIDDALAKTEDPNILESFLRYRVDEAKPTIVTMNNNVALSPTLESLLHETVYLVFTGTDRRVHPLERSDGRW